MIEITLTKNDYDRIKDLAHKLWIDKANTGDNFLCICYTQAFISYVASKGYIVENGKVYVKET